MSDLETLLKDYVEDSPQPIIGAKTIQIVLMREVLDYAVLRTEDTRELNTVATPLSVNKAEDTLRVAFLATKQKAAESRQLEQSLRTATQAVNMAVPNGPKNDGCYLKDNLCMECPRCGLFGATNTDTASDKKGQIKHRIEYSTAFSLLPFEEIETATTFNGINDLTVKTDQALGTRYAVRPATIFPSIITLKSATLREVVLVIKTLLACKSYGAETRIGGDMRNSVFGIIAGWEEIITPLELTLELYEAHTANKSLSPQIVQEILNRYQAMAGYPDKVTIFAPDQVEKMVKAAADMKLDEPFLKGAYDDVKQYRDQQDKKRK